MEKEKEIYWQNFKQMVADMTDNKFYEEVVSCRMISFGSCEGDDKEYFFDLINAYAENKYKAKAEVDEEKLRDIAYDETASIRDQGDKDYFVGYDLGDIIRDVAVDSFLKGYQYNKAKEEK